MICRLTLGQNVSNRDASAFDVIYTYSTGPVTWPVTVLGLYKDRAVVVVNAPVNLMTQPPATMRVFRTHYPTAPTHEDYAISSVQP